MYIDIDTSKVDHIVIAIPSGFSQFLENTVALFETNAVFIADNYLGREVVEPSITITLGKTFKLPKEYDRKELVLEYPTEFSVMGEKSPAKPYVVFPSEEEKSQQEAPSGEASVAPQQEEDNAISTAPTK